MLPLRLVSHSRPARRSPTAARIDNRNHRRPCRASRGLRRYVRVQRRTTFENPIVLIPHAVADTAGQIASGPGRDGDRSRRNVGRRFPRQIGGDGRPVSAAECRGCEPLNFFMSISPLFMIAFVAIT